MKTRQPKTTPELDLEQQKQVIAYQLWEEEGRPEGKAEAHWHQACLVVMSLGEGETANPPVWLKRNDEPIVDASSIMDETLNKRTATRHAA
jgi:Protein of unknown function (DUF2934)